MEKRQRVTLRAGIGLDEFCIMSLSKKDIEILNRIAFEVAEAIWEAKKPYMELMYTCMLEDKSKLRQGANETMNA